MTFLTTRTSTGSKVDVFHQSQPLTQSSDVTHAVRVVKNVTCLSSLFTYLERYPSPSPLLSPDVLADVDVVDLKLSIMADMICHKVYELLMSILNIFSQ